jgi:hypothetical protein
MKEFTFTAWCTLGAGHSGETFVDVELTDKEARKLKKYGTQSDIYYDGFSECEQLKDLYQKIYNIAVEQMTDEMRDYGDLDEKKRNDPDWKVDDTYTCGVEFPDEFEDMLDEED